MDPVTHEVRIIVFFGRVDCQDTPGIQQFVTNLEITKRVNLIYQMAYTTRLHLLQDVSSGNPNP